MAEEFAVEGLAELERDLLDLDAQMGAKTLRAAGRESMKPVLAAAQAGVHKDSGDLHDSLGISARKAKGDNAAFIAVGPVRKKALKSAGGRALNRVNAKALSQEYGNIRQQADPFLRPALDNNVEKVLSTLASELGKRIDKAMRKAGK